MIAEFEHLYRHLGLPEEMDAAAVRSAFAARVAAFERQRDDAGSKAERLIAAKALRETSERKDDVERLATALEALAAWREAGAAFAQQAKAAADEFKSALAARKAAAASRQTTRAKGAAQRADEQARQLAGLAAQLPVHLLREAAQAARKLADELADAASALEAELADSGLVRDSVLEAEIDQLEGRATALEERFAAGEAAGPAPDLGGAIEALQQESAALAARTARQKDSPEAGRVAAVVARLKSAAAQLESRRAGQALRADLDRLRTARERLEAASTPDALAQAAPEKLRAALADADAALGDKALAPDFPAGARATDFAAEREKLAVLRDRLRAALVRRELVLALEALETEAAAGRCSADFPTRLAALNTDLAKLAEPALVARGAALGEALAKAAERRQLAAAIEQLETAAEARRFDGDFPDRLARAEEAANKGGDREFAGRLARVRAAFLESKKPPAPPPAARPAAAPTPPPVKSAPPPIPLEQPTVLLRRSEAPPTAFPEPPAADRLTLVGPEGERCHVLALDRVAFGRSSTNDVMVRACHPANPKEELRVTKSISRVQFTVTKEHDDVMLADGGQLPDGAWKASANGTFEPGGKPVDRVRLFRSGLTGFRITQESAPAIAPQWEVRLQMRAALPPPLAALRDALPPGPDALLLHRSDGACEDVLLLWRAASMKDLGLAGTETCLLRHKGGFVLWQENRAVGLEMGFRVGATWTVARFGALEYRP